MPVKSIKKTLLVSILFLHITLLKFFRVMFSDIIQVFLFSFYVIYFLFLGPVGWGCRINRLHLCSKIHTRLPNKRPEYKTKQLDGDAPVLELWEMWKTPPLPLPPSPLWPVRIPFMDHLTVLTDAKLKCLSYTFELQSHYCVHFRTNTLGKGRNPLFSPARVSQLFFYKDGFGIK